MYDILLVIMIEKYRKPDTDNNKPLHELEPGDMVKDTLLLGWQYVMPIPKLVAETWFSQLHTNTQMNDKEATPSEQKIRYWQEGYGVVVGKPIAYPGWYQLSLLSKGPDGFSLFLTKNEFPEDR